MDIQQSINLALYKRFAEEEIEFAYPTQTLYLERSEENAVDGQAGEGG
jgi:small-conductance mechanosensitive channel